MNNSSNVELCLKELLELLLIEKKELISNKSDRMSEIVEKKAKIVKQLELLDIHASEVNENIKNMSLKIKEVQRINIILTKQALNFQEKLVEAVVGSIKDDVDVYSNNGGYKNKDQSVNFVDREI